jgi:hypothetical protein
MAVDKTGSDWPAPEGRNAMAGGGVGISWRERRGLSRGKKSQTRRCGRTIEAKPAPGQTCLIEPALDRPFVAR